MIKDTFPTRVYYSDEDFEYIKPQQKELMNIIFDIVFEKKKIYAGQLKREIKIRTNKRPNNSTMSGILRMMVAMERYEVNGQVHPVSKLIGMRCIPTRRHLSRLNAFKYKKEIYLKNHNVRQMSPIWTTIQVLWRT